MEKEIIPSESETIAAKRAIRVAEKIAEARERLKIKKAWWSRGFIESFFFVIIFLVNFFLVFEFFGTSSSTPFFSGPVVPLIAKFIEFWGVPLGYAIQIVNIFFYLLFPASFYIFVRFVTERKLVAFIATLVASLPYYPLALVRANSSLVGVDAAHIASLSIIPIALFASISFMRKGGAANLSLAAFLSALVALISPFGLLSYLIFAGITGFSEVLLGKGRLKMLRLLAILLFAAGLNSFWYNPGFFVFMLTGSMGFEIRSMISKLIPVSFFIIPVLGAFGYLLFDRKPNLQPHFLASFYTISFAIITLAGGGIFPSHPSRYVTELGISLSFLTALFLVQYYDYLKLKDRMILGKLKSRYLSNTILLLVFLGVSLGFIFGKENLTSENRQVLGIWDNVERGDIWRAKDKFGGTSAVLGYAITGGSVLGLSFISARTRKGV